MSLDPKTQNALRALGIDSGGSQDDASPPIDLRTIPREKWDEYLCFPIQLPPDVAAYLAHAEGALSGLEIDNIEDRIIAFYEIAPPFTIAMESKVARLLKE